MNEDDLTLYTWAHPEGETEVAIGLGAARRRVTALRAEARAQEEATRHSGDSPAEASRAAAYATALDELADSAELPKRGDLWVLNFDTGSQRGLGGLLQVTPVAPDDEGAVLYESDCEESLWALAREAGIDFEEERCDPLALLWSLRGQQLADRPLKSRRGPS